MYCPSDGSKFYQQFLGQNYLTYSPVKINRHRSNNSTGILKTDRIRSVDQTPSPSTSKHHRHQYNSNNSNVNHFIFEETQFSQYLNGKFQNKIKIEKIKRLSAMKNTSVIEKIFSSYEKRIFNCMNNGILIQSIKYLKDKKSKTKHDLLIINHNHLERNENMFQRFKATLPVVFNKKNTDDGGRKVTIKAPKQQPLMTIVSSRTISVIPWEKLILGWNKLITTSEREKNKIHLVKCLLGELIPACIDDGDSFGEAANVTAVESMSSELLEVLRYRSYCSFYYFYYYHN